MRELRAVVPRSDAGAGRRGLHGAERVAMLDVRDVDRAGEGGEERAAVHGLSGVLRTGLFAADHAEVGLVMMGDVQQHGEHERREVPERPRVHFAAAIGVVGGGARITD